MPRDDPLALLLHAQSAQLDGDREGAQRAFRAMAEREDTRLLGLRGLFIEAQRADDAVARGDDRGGGAEDRAVLDLGLACGARLPLRQGRLERRAGDPRQQSRAGLIDKATYRRHRGVLLTARALELERVDRDMSRESVMEAVKLAPTLMPAAVLAGQIRERGASGAPCDADRRKRRGWPSRIPILPTPMPMSGSAIPRGSGWCGSRRWRRRRLAMSRARWRSRAPRSTPRNSPARARCWRRSSTRPTQRVAMLMAEIERSEHGDGGRARAWTLRAVRARTIRCGPRTAMSAIAGGRSRRSPAGSMRSGGRRPVAACPRTRRRDRDRRLRGAMSAPRRVGSRARRLRNRVIAVDVPSPVPAAPSAASALRAREGTGDVPAAIPAPSAPIPAVGRAGVPDRAGLPRRPSSIHAVIPIVRAPDDPGIDDEGRAMNLRNKSARSRPGKGPGRRLARIFGPAWGA